MKITMHHEEPGRVPLMEGTVGYTIQSQFLGKTVTEADLNCQVEFWIQAGYDNVPLGVGLMNPGEITGESGIVGAVQKAMRKTVLTFGTYPIKI